MPSRAGGAAAVIAWLVLALGGCGASASRSSFTASFTASFTSSSPSSTPTTTSSATTRSSGRSTSSTSSTSSRRRSAPRHATKHHRAGGAKTTASRTTSTEASKTQATLTTPPTTPSGTPSAPVGLAQTVGYGTYELCQGVCTGSVPSSLRRPLQLPADDGGPCPVTLRANGPVFPSTGTEVGMSGFIGSSWPGVRVTWVAGAAYQGPILIRGAQIGGTGAVGFGEGHTPYDELQLLDSGQGARPVVDGGRAWLAYTRVPSSGCYGYQVDGTSFSEVLVFRAVG
jgi:hypothetical protein